MAKEKKPFELTEDHIKLIKAAYVRWEDCEYGAPAIDCKRPYGNSSVEHDIQEILGRPMDGSEAREIHEETQQALQIIINNTTIEPGFYKASGKWGGGPWVSVDAPEKKTYTMHCLGRYEFKVQAASEEEAQEAASRRITKILGKVDGEWTFYSIPEIK